MIKFTDLEDKIYEEAAPAAPPAAPAPKTPAPKPQLKCMINIKYRVDNITKKIKDSKTNQNASATFDKLTLKLKNFKINQSIKIKIKPNIEIVAFVKQGKDLKNRDKRYCKLIKSNLDEISSLLNNKETNLVDTNQQPLKQGQEIFFQTFPDRKNKNITWFYFYNNVNDVLNNKEPIFSKSCYITDIE